MTFISPPVGLVRSGHFARYTDWVENNAWPSGTIVTCPADEPFAPFVIFTPQASTVSFAADPANMDWFSAAFSDLSYAPYYTLRVRMRGPNRLGQWNDPPACLVPPATYDNAGPFAAVSVDADLVASDGTSVDTTVAASLGDANGLTVEGYLVNPAPPWPTPDAFGNTFGSVLWTATQIGTVTGDIDVERGPATGAVANNGLSVTVYPYFEDEVDEAQLRSVRVVGAV